MQGDNGRDQANGSRGASQLRRIGVRELRQHASRWLQQVAGGESFEITDRGRPVALLSPLTDTESAIDKLMRNGQLRPPRDTGARAAPTPIGGQGPLVSEVLADMREDEQS